MNLTKPLLQRVAIAQLCSTSSKHQNLLNIAFCAREAKKEGCSMLFLPECFGFIGSSAQQTLENAEDIASYSSTDLNSLLENDTSNEWIHNLQDVVINEMNNAKEMNILDNSDVSITEGIRVIAKSSDLWISGGGIHESNAPAAADGDNARVYNTHIIVNSLGDIVSQYRKIHLFDVSIPSRNIHLKESATTAPGEKLVVCETPVGMLGLSTCYDMRFPEMYRHLVEEGNAEILLMPSAFTIPTGQAHWHTLLRARAIENQCYVIAAAQYGEHNEKRESYGHAIGIDPWGRVLVDAGGIDGSGTQDEVTTPSIVVCDIKKDEIESVRERMPIKLHRLNSPFSW